MCLVCLPETVNVTVAMEQSRGLRPCVLWLNVGPIVFSGMVSKKTLLEWFRP